MVIGQITNLSSPTTFDVEEFLLRSKKIQSDLNELLEEARVLDADLRRLREIALTHRISK